MKASPWLDDSIEDLAALTERYPEAHPVALAMQIDHVDRHCRDFLARCPFVVLSTTNVDGTGDASPKGGPPGIVRVLDDHHVAIGDLPGNNRLDGLRNVVRNPAVGLLCLIPGKGETLRINGRGHVVTNAAVLERCAVGGKQLTTALVVRGRRERSCTARRRSNRSGLWEPEPLGRPRGPGVDGRDGDGPHGARRRRAGPIDGGPWRVGRASEPSASGRGAARPLG